MERFDDELRSLADDMDVHVGRHSSPLQIAQRIVARGSYNGLDELVTHLMNQRNQEQDQKSAELEEEEQELEEEEDDDDYVPRRRSRRRRRRGGDSDDEQMDMDQDNDDDQGNDDDQDDDDQEDDDEQMNVEDDELSGNGADAADAEDSNDAANNQPQPPRGPRRELEIIVVVDFCGYGTVSPTENPNEKVVHPIPVECMKQLVHRPGGFADLMNKPGGKKSLVQRIIRMKGVPDPKYNVTYVPKMVELSRSRYQLSVTLFILIFFHFVSLQLKERNVSNGRITQ